jgi:hypothetical protein
MADFTGKIHTSALHQSQNGRLFCISTAALIINIPLTSWGNEMIFTEKIEKRINLTAIIKIYSINSTEN